MKATALLALACAFALALVLPAAAPARANPWIPYRPHPAQPHHRLRWPAHTPGWLCIHHGEGAWHDRDSGHNGHYGGLQMHPNWGYGTSYYASSDPPIIQVWAAERGYRASRYSRSWLYQQWGADFPRCSRFF